MIGTEIVNTAQNIHASLQGLGLAGQRASAANQVSQPLAEGGIKPFNKSGVDAAVCDLE